MAILAKINYLYGLLSKKTYMAVQENSHCKPNFVTNFQFMVNLLEREKLETIVAYKTAEEIKSRDQNPNCPHFILSLMQKNHREIYPRFLVVHLIISLLKLLMYL